MFSLNAREQMFIVAVLVITLTGAAVKYWRETRHESAPVSGAAHVAAGIQTAAGGGKPLGAASHP